MRSRLARCSTVVVLSLLALAVAWTPVQAQGSGQVRALVQVADTGDQTLAHLSRYGSVDFVFPEIGFVAMNIKAKDARPGSALRSDPLVLSVSRDHQVSVHTHTGLLAWDQDIIDVERVHPAGDVQYDGTGVYVAVLDTGLVPNWQDYFPAARVASDLGRAFHSPVLGTPGSPSFTDTNSHGTHVTSTILGYSLYGLARFEGTAPGATVIPVKVLSNKGWGWDSSVIAGILYVANLKKDGVLDGPVVINMSLGGSEGSPAELAAIRYAIRQGVLIVASAGNEGEAGMGYPGAFAEVISAGAAGWVREWVGGRTWWQQDVPDPTTAADVYVTDFSSRELPGQELDVLAPGSWVVGPYLAYGAAHPPYWANGVPGQYYFLGGTSMAAPHVTGTVALLLQKNPSLTQAQAEAVLRSTALYIPPGSATVATPYGTTETFTWSSDATGYGLIDADAAVAATP
ncbi:S8 family peptidase [Limnochorda pilosa]|uniref:Peptidase S8 n=1 Tax=Limnochorda pilosa TaxID=1555112 RepID=A0A0K2SGY9_LIMPI|nr:S8 family serine peptidase [Limnochorda pilosa]BAS26381.1 peptidase S8 [Limnochorda pilosa]